MSACEARARTAVAVRQEGVVNRLVGLLHTSIGQKLTLAATGVALIGFLFVHMIGNLWVFQGREAMNAYAAWIQSHPLLWLARGGLLGLFVVHTTLALKLAWQNHRSRPDRYTSPRTHREATILSRYIALTGLLVLSFVAYHLLHFTFGQVQPEHARLIDEAGRHDVYGMVVRGFQVPTVALSYLIAMAVLGLHLAHGLRSLLQTFGLHHESYVGGLRAACWIAVGVLVAGNATIPLSVWLGWIRP